MALSLVIFLLNRDKTKPPDAKATARSKDTIYST